MQNKIKLHFVQEFPTNMIGNLSLQDYNLYALVWFGDSLLIIMSIIRWLCQHFMITYRLFSSSICVPLSLLKFMETFQ